MPSFLVVNILTFNYSWYAILKLTMNTE